MPRFYYMPRGVRAKRLSFEAWERIRDLLGDHGESPNRGKYTKPQCVTMQFWEEGKKVIGEVVAIDAPSS